MLVLGVRNNVGLNSLIDVDFIQGVLQTKPSSGYFIQEPFCIIKKNHCF